MHDSQVRAENTAVSAPVPEPTLSAPHGLEQILATFGDIHAYSRPDGSLDPRWQADFLATVALPFPLRLSWDHSKFVMKMTCHKRLTETFREIFSLIQARELRPRISSFGGCFVFRTQRTGTRLSTHSWGIALDLNPETNSQGSTGNMDPELIDIFRSAGFSWGGDWPGKARDPMHFQFCTGY